MENQIKEFLSNIRLTTSEIDDAKKKYSGVCKKLHAHYYPDQDYNGKTKLLFGSYGKKTNIRPATDIDVIFKLPSSEKARYMDHKSNGSYNLLAKIKEILKEKYSNTEIGVDGKVVVVSFSEPSHKVEVVPGWENEDGSFLIPNTYDKGSWEIFAVREDLKNLKESEVATGITRDLIRCVKKWSKTISVKVKSHEIEGIVLEYLQLGSNNKLDVGFLIGFFEYYKTRAQAEPLSDAICTALGRLQKAQEYYLEENILKASEQLQLVFGKEFPIRDEKSMKTFGAERPDISQQQILYPSPTEEFIGNFVTEVSTETNLDFHIDCFVDTSAGFRSGWLSELLKKFPASFLIKKKTKLCFQVINNEKFIGYSVYWKVRNFGEEAASAGQLRGQIVKDDGSYTKLEPTKFHGKHFVEAYLVKNGTCVAISSIYVPIQ